jgi:hypothetical protein
LHTQGIKRNRGLQAPSSLPSAALSPLGTGARPMSPSTTSMPVLGKVTLPSKLCSVVQVPSDPPATTGFLPIAGS